MKNIKFKAKRIDNEKWVYGYYYQIWEKGYILWGMTDDKPNMIEVIPETLCQYIGLKDENEREIYENDKVYCDYKYQYGVIKLDNDYAAFGIEWDDGCWTDFYAFDSEDLVVIK